MTNEYGYAKHPKSGETYAVEYNDAGTIIRAVGPIHYTDVNAPAEDVVTNSANDGEAQDDGEWLQNEMEKYS